MPVRIAELFGNSPAPETARKPRGNGSGREIEGLIEQTGAECWQCLHEERSGAGSQQRPQKSEIEGHGGTRVWT